MAWKFVNKIITKTGIFPLSAWNTSFQTSDPLNDRIMFYKTEHSVESFEYYRINGFFFYDFIVNGTVNDEQTIFELKNNSTLKIKKLSMSGSNYQYAWMFYDQNGNLFYQHNCISRFTTSAGVFTEMLSLIEKDGLLYLAWGQAQSSGNYSGFIEARSGYMTDVTTLFRDAIPLPDPYSTNESETPEGGYGPYDYTSEQELPPAVPAISAASAGFISLWNPTVAQLKALADWLWSGSFALSSWRAIFSKPMDCILSIGIIPIKPTRYTEGQSEVPLEIEFTGTGTGINAFKITEQYYVVDMGSVHISGMSNSNMDYAPYAKASIFLPYCGTYALDVDEIMDADIALEYHIDIYTGACVAYLTISGKVNSDSHQVEAVLYQFTGNCLATIPATSVDHSQFIQSLLFMGASIAATVATSGGAAPAAAGADLGAEAGMSAGAIAASAGSAINTVMSMKPNVLHSGNLSSTAGFLGGQKPYITMTWSNLCRADDEYKIVGMPLNKSGQLKDFKGLTVVSGVHLESIKCTDTERAMIEQALYKGVIV